MSKVSRVTAPSYAVLDAARTSTGKASRPVREKLKDAYLGEARRPGALMTESQVGGPEKTEDVQACWVLSPLDGKVTC